MMPLDFYSIYAYCQHYAKTGVAVLKQMKYTIQCYKEKEMNELKKITEHGKTSIEEAPLPVFLGCFCSVFFSVCKQILSIAFKT